jgi:class 3 adenylate cyclase
MNAEIDVRRVLPTIQAPTLVLHARDDAQVDVRHGRELARLIPGARWVELDGRDHVPFGEHRDRIANEIHAFLGECAQAHEPERVLTTVLMTDIVGSTERATEVGDRAWRDLLQRHHALVRQALAAHRGREIDTAGDGFLASFDGPARAVRCAARVVRELHDSLGIDVRAGVHTGECERVGEKVAGIAVHIGARVMAAAHSGEVLVSSTVKDLVAGSGLRFADRGLQPLKGIAEAWRLFAVDLASAA